MVSRKLLGSECQGCRGAQGHCARCPLGHRLQVWGSQRSRSLWRCGGCPPLPCLLVDVSCCRDASVGSGCSRGVWASLRGGDLSPPGKISGGPCCVWHCLADDHHAVGACSLLEVFAAVYKKEWRGGGEGLHSDLVGSLPPNAGAQDWSLDHFNSYPNPPMSHQREWKLSFL